MAIKRRDGKYAGEHAELHSYADNTSRIMISLDKHDAEILANNAIASGGSVEVTISVNGNTFKGNAVEARIDTVTASGEKIAGPGVIGFENLHIQ
ncbi:MAG: hypothetical protein WA790_09995 [Sulfitobacter sp.]